MHNSLTIIGVVDENANAREKREEGLSEVTHRKAAALNKIAAHDVKRTPTMK